MKAATMNRRHTAPIKTQRTNRSHEVRALSSMPAGKMVPLAAVPLLREDSVRRGTVQVAIEMMETAEILMNQVNVEVHAYLVPWLAFERFGGSMDILNRSWQGEPRTEGGTVVVPWYDMLESPTWQTGEFFGGNGIGRYLGHHARNGQILNMAYREAYNAIWNHRVANRSRDIDKAALSNNVLLPALWHHQAFQHIVPDFDQAVIDGEVALRDVQFNAQYAPVETTGNAILISNQDGSQQGTLQRDTADKLQSSAGNGFTANQRFADADESLRADLSVLVNEINASGFSVSLADIDAAKRTAAFAKIRQKYAGIDEDWVINMLMDGITIPEQSLKYPILLNRQTNIFGMSKRYASDSGNLTESVVSGMTVVNMNINLPRISTGGIIMLVAEVTPDQLWERKQDPMLHAVTQPYDDGQGDTPLYLRDTLDPEKVEIVANAYVDNDHDTPDGTFGYAPLNHKWNVSGGRVGGRFYRPEVDAGFDEDRQRIWAVETQNPTLSEDFYLATQMHTKPFVVTDQDPFEVVTNGIFVINGNTVFGGVLVEASNDYDLIQAKVPAERLEKA